MRSTFYLFICILSCCLFSCSENDILSDDSGNNIIPEENTQSHIYIDQDTKDAIRVFCGLPPQGPSTRKIYLKYNWSSVWRDCLVGRGGNCSSTVIIEAPHPKDYTQYDPDDQIILDETNFIDLEWGKTEESQLLDNSQTTKEIIFNEDTGKFFIKYTNKQNEVFVIPINRLD